MQPEQAIAMYDTPTVPAIALANGGLCGLARD